MASVEGLAAKDTPDVVVVETTGVESGGGAVGRLEDGRTVFVRGALPGERVAADVLEQRPRYAVAAVRDVLTASPDRVTPPCRSVAAGCGGCDLQHAALRAQHSMKVAVVSDALRRIGKVTAIPPIRVVEMADLAFRTTVRAVARSDGSLGFRHARSHDWVAAPQCLVAHPIAARILGGARFPGASEVTIRIGARTGEALAVVDPAVGDVLLPPEIDPTTITVVGTADAASAFLHEEAAGRRWRISGRSFFQSRPDGAEALVTQVREALRELAGTPRRLVDLCAGVGLFAATVDAREVVAVEANRAAAADARHNLADLRERVKVIATSIERWRPSPADAVIADPPRSGLRRVGVERIVATGAAVVVLVSCDAGSFGRDAGLLTAAGYRLDRVTLVDMFPHTHHVEVVAGFVADQRST